jgi:hypothetical protein
MKKGFDKPNTQAYSCHSEEKVIHNFETSSPRLTTLAPKMSPSQPPTSAENIYFYLFLICAGQTSVG